jgi:hypothetical protein
MERVKTFIVLLILVCFGYSLNAQTFSSEKNKQEAEQILNLIINSQQFDSIYSTKKVYFEANELLTIDSPLLLKRKKCKVSIVKDGSLLKNKHFVVLGDFTIDWNNPVAARVQLSIMPEDVLLSIGLVKINSNWIIKNHAIFKD